MTNYQNDIMDLLQGDTPRQKHDYLVELLKIFKRENASETEQILLNVCYKLDEDGKQAFKTQGSESYEFRCSNYDAREMIYSLTNKWRFEKLSWIQWTEQIKCKFMLTEEQIKSNHNIPTEEIQQDIRITKIEIDQLDSELKILRSNPIENRLRIYMNEGKVLKRKEFCDDLKQILEYRLNMTT